MVTRYDCVTRSYDESDYGEMEPDENGTYVSADDYDALLKVLREIVSIEKRMDDVRGSGMVDFPEVKAVRAMAQKARAALPEDKAAV